jgi:hypothetical protein
MGAPGRRNRRRWQGTMEHRWAPENVEG